MFGYLTANASSAALRASPSAGELSHWPSVTSPETLDGSNAGAWVSPVLVVAGGPPVDGAFELPPPPVHAAARNAVAKNIVRIRLRMGRVALLGDPRTGAMG